MNPSVGKCKCPSCGEHADVCQNSKGKNRTYYIRCGTVFAGSGSDGCGVLQGRGPRFQKYVKDNAQWIAPEDHEAREVAGEQAAAEAKAKVAEHAHKIVKEKAAQATEEKPAATAAEKPKSSWTIL